jgi:hypothetical protein
MVVYLLVEFRIICWISVGPTPMTLGNMRAQGVRSLAVTCGLCHHDAVIRAEPKRT